MTEIKISNLHPAGSELFQDLESFLDELTTDETALIRGGIACSDLMNLLVALSLLHPNYLAVNNRQAGESIATVYGNSLNNNSIVNQSLNAQTAANLNTINAV